MHSALMAETGQAHKLAEYPISAEGYPVQHSELQCVQGLLLLGTTEGIRKSLYYNAIPNFIVTIGLLLLAS